MKRASGISYAVFFVHQTFKEGRKTEIAKIVFISCRQIDEIYRVPILCITFDSL